MAVIAMFEGNRDVHDGRYLRGWSPGHQGPLTTSDSGKAKRFRDAAAVASWWAKQPGGPNWGQAKFRIEEAPPR